jgi:hypothetical protein
MPLEEYMALKDLLLREDLEVIQLLEDFLQFKERTNLSLNLLKISKYFQKEKQLLKLLIEREVHLENDVNILFNHYFVLLLTKYCVNSFNRFRLFLEQIH